MIICNEFLKKGCYARVRKMVKIGKMSQDITAANGILIWQFQDDCTNSLCNSTLFLALSYISFSFGVTHIISFDRYFENVSFGANVMTTR